MAFADPPSTAAWRHRDAREGFEVVFLERGEDGYRFEGHVSAVEDDDAWAVRYSILLDASWLTQRARIGARSASGARELGLESSGTGAWRVNGAAAPELDGCLDVDLEASAFTNALPVHRLRLEVGQSSDAPAVWVRALDLSVERLEQRYARLEADGRRQRYDYAAPELDFETRLVFDEFGLVLDYPGIAVRAA